MKKLIVALILLIGGFSRLFSMSPTEELAQLKAEMAFKEKHEKELEALKKRLKEAEAKAEGRKETTQKQYAQDFKAHKAEHEQHVTREGAKTVLRITNNSKWNVLVRYKHQGKTHFIQKLSIQPHGSGDIPTPKDVMFLEIVPDGSYWQKNLKSFREKGKVTVPDLAEDIGKILNRNPNSSVNIEVTIPKLSGGTFKGFAFDIKPLEIKGFTMTLKEYIEKRKAGEITEPGVIGTTDEPQEGPPQEETVKAATLESFTKDIMEDEGLSKEQKQQLIDNFKEYL